MPIVLLLLGGLFITAAIKGTEHQLGTLLQGDFTGPKSFLVWIAAIGVIGGLGYIPVLKTPSRYMLALILVVMLFTDEGFFAKFSQAIQAGVTPLPSVPYPSGSSSSGSSSSSSSSSGSGFDVSSVAKIAAVALI